MLFVHISTPRIDARIKSRKKVTKVVVVEVDVGRSLELLSDAIACDIADDSDRSTFVASADVVVVDHLVDFTSLYAKENATTRTKNEGKNWKSQIKKRGVV